tara:strand:+ start:124 stop:306 length:183 start_codon:yes stop_codon:yes gene_type:complete
VKFQRPACFRFHAEQAPMNDVSATSMSLYWLSGHDDAPDLAIYDGNGIRQRGVLSVNKRK